jgi:hypothetical protein
MIRTSSQSTLARRTKPSAPNGFQLDAANPPEGGDDEQRAAIVMLKPIQLTTVSFLLVGDAPVVTHNWSAKSLSEMRTKAQDKVREKRKPKDPKAEFEAACYRIAKGRYGVPCNALKQAIVNACRYHQGITMTLCYVLINTNIT